MMRVIPLSVVGFILVTLGIGCSTAPKTDPERAQLSDSAQAALKKAQATDPELTPFLNRSAGYAVFPQVGKGAFGVGGVYGRGVVYENGEMTGYADITQGTVGLQAGGQTFDEIVVFESKADVDRFKTGKLTFAANVSAVALKSGAAKSAKYSDGVAVFTQTDGGLMFEASIGGQQFTYVAR